ncbi:MAG TPA: IS256 family transposase [Caldisericia bacterium]|jgi:putative transposase|nr:IS256 family transposase [Caldisericia bacterium]
MKVYQLNNESVNGSIEITDSELLYAKAQDGLLELSVSLGLEVMRMMLEEDVAQYAGPKGKHKTAGRTGYRHGTEKTTVVMGGSKVRADRPRVRALDGGELPLPTLGLFQNEDPLNQAILSKLLAGISVRKYARTVEGGADSVCASKSEVSRRFVEGMDVLMQEFFTRKLDQDYPVMMIDGLELGKMTILAAMGIDSDGKKRVLGISEGGSENSVVVKGLLEDLISRGLEADRPRLYVLDGGKALHKAVLDTFGKSAVIQRCQVHKKRNVLSYLPESAQANASMAITMAYREFDYDAAKSKLLAIASEFEYKYPKAAASLLEGLDETLTVHRLKVPGALRETLCSTNPMESANSACRGVIRRVCNFRDGGMALRYAAAGFIEAEHGFRRVKGYRQLPILSSMLSAQYARTLETRTA